MPSVLPHIALFLGFFSSFSSRGCDEKEGKNLLLKEASFAQLEGQALLFAEAPQEPPRMCPGEGGAGTTGLVWPEQLPSWPPVAVLFAKAQLAVNHLPPHPALWCWGPGGGW